MCVLTPDKTTPTYILCRRKENRWQGGRKDCWCVASLSHAQLFLTPILLALDESDIRIMKTYVFALPLLLIPFKGQGPYAQKLKDVDKDIKDIQKRINDKLGTAHLCPYIFPLTVPRRQGI